mgnify:CR=1 FL=1
METFPLNEYSLLIHKYHLIERLTNLATSRDVGSSPIACKFLT